MHEIVVGHPPANVWYRASLHGLTAVAWNFYIFGRICFGLVGSGDPTAILSYVWL